MSRSLQLEKVSILAPLGFLQIIIAFLIDILIFKEDLKANEVIGSVMIVGVLLISNVMRACGYKNI